MASMDRKYRQNMLNISKLLIIKKQYRQVMSQEYKEISFEEWIRTRAQKLQRIDQRFSANIKKYQERKRNSQSSEEQMMMDQGDEICEDWRKLNQINTIQAPFILNKFSRNKKTIKRVNTVKTQLQRLIKKIEKRIDTNDVEQYRSKTRLKNWQSPNVKKSKLIFSKSEKRSSSFEQLINQNEEQQFSMQNLKQIGKANLKRIQMDVQRNSWLVKQYDQQKQLERYWFKLLLVIIVLLVIIICIDIHFIHIPVKTDVFSFFIDFVQP